MNRIFIEESLRGYRYIKRGFVSLLLGDVNLMFVGIRRCVGFSGVIYFIKKYLWLFKNKIRICFFNLYVFFLCGC